MSTGDGSEGLPGEIPIVTSLVVGAASFVVGYVLTIGVLILDGALESGGSSGGGSGGSGDSPDQFLEFMGTLFYEAHFVDLEVTTAQGTSTFDLLTRIDLVLPDLAYHAVPVVVLLLGGFVVVWRAGDRIGSTASASRAGASIVVAYLPLVVVGTRYFEFGGSVAGFDFDVGPPLVQSALRAGILYPVVFGALGGLAYYWLRQR